MRFQDLAGRFRIFLVSNLDYSFVRECRLTPARGPEAALKSALANVTSDLRVAYMAQASMTLPITFWQVTHVPNHPAGEARIPMEHLT
jgi:hypothetical protein